MAGAEGASLRELMERMGHSSTRAAVIYQHRTMQRDKVIADVMGARAMAELNRSGKQPTTDNVLAHLFPDRGHLVMTVGFWREERRRLD